MLTRSTRSSRFSRVLLLLVLTTFVGATGCSTLPRNHWWQFWRKKPATTVAGLYNPDQVTVPPPPDALGQGTTGSPLAPGGLQGAPGEVTDADPLRRPPAGTVTALKTVHFAYNSDALSPGEQQVLDGNAQWLTANPGLQISIEGHCDQRGTREYNLGLGERRAKAVKAYLMQRGVEGDRMHTNTFGSEAPLDPALTEQAYAKNRRVQFLVY